MSDQNKVEKTNSKPSHTLRKKFWSGKRTEFETLGVAWEREDGSLYIKLYGTQVIEGGFYVFPNKKAATGQGGQ